MALSEEKAIELAKDLQKTFRESKPVILNTDEPTAAIEVKVTTETIDKNQINDLDSYGIEYETDILIKRSGTGLSIKFI